MKKHCFRNCLKSILNQIQLQRNKNCHQHNLPINCNVDMLMSCQKSHPDVCGKLPWLRSVKLLAWAILNRIFYPKKSWQVLFSPKMTRLHIYFLLLCFLSRTPSSIPSYPKPVNISFPSKDPIPTIQPSSVQYLSDKCSFSHYLIFVWLWAHFSALVPLTELRGHCSIQNRLCTLMYLQSKEWHLLI